MRAAHEATGVKSQVEYLVLERCGKGEGLLVVLRSVGSSTFPDMRG